MVKGLTPGLLEIGKIKIGIKGKMIESAQGNKFQPPKKLDHFVVTTTKKGEDGNYIEDEEIKNIFGLEKDSEIKSIPVRLLYNDPDLNFPTRYASYNGGKLTCSGDGEKAITAMDRQIECPCKKLDNAYQGKDKCKINGTLSVIIDNTNKFGGCHKFRTTSFNTCSSILGSMAIIKHATGGILAFLPLHLTIQPKTTTIPTTGGTTTIYVVSLIYPGNVSELQQAAFEMATEKRQYLLAMKEIENKAKSDNPFSSEDEKEIVEEFYPEAVDISCGEPKIKEVSEVIEVKPASEEIITIPAEVVLEKSATETEAKIKPEPVPVKFGGFQEDFVECYKGYEVKNDVATWKAGLAKFGFEKAGQITDPETARKVLAELNYDIPF